MSGTSQRFLSGIAPTTLDRRQVLKSLYVVLGVQVALLALVYSRRYPLTVPEASMVGAAGYWLLLVSMVGIASLLAYCSRRAGGSLVATATVFVVLDSYQLLYFSVAGGDTAGEIVDISLISHLAHLDPGQLSYLEWPASYIFALTLMRLTTVSSAVSAVDVGYAVYCLLFVLAVWWFTYRLGDGFLAYVASVSYLTLSFIPLNNQFVPQFLALILLFFLFTVSYRAGFAWRIVEALLFVVLLFAHPIFPLLYPLSLSIRPAVVSLLSRYRADSSYGTVSAAIADPGTLLRTVLSPATWVPNSRRFAVRTAALWLLFFAKNPPWDIFATVTGPQSETVGNPVALLQSRLLPMFSGGESTASQAGGPLYDVVPRSVDAATAWGSRVVVLSVFVLLVAAFLYTDLRDTPDSNGRDISVYQTEILVASSLFFAAGWLLNSTYAIRALQVAFLPVALFYYGVRRHRRAVIAVILVVSLFAPVLVANTYVNNSITAGGTSMGYHETQAGETLGEHYPDNDRVVVPPRTPYPTGTLDNPRAADLRFLLDGRMDPPDSGLVVTSERLRSYLEYRGYDCDLSSEGENVVYDNSVEVVSKSGGDGVLDCSRPVGT